MIKEERAAKAKEIFEQASALFAEDSPEDYEVWKKQEEREVMVRQTDEGEQIGMVMYPEGMHEAGEARETSPADRAYEYGELCYEYVLKTMDEEHKKKFLEAEKDENAEIVIRRNNGELEIDTKISEEF